MLPDTSHGNQIAFFEIAATLIPILLFGGVVAERRGPQSRDSHRKTTLYATYIPAVGSMAILGEIVAIIAIVTGTSTWWMRLLVALVLTLGMLAVVLAVWWPWHQDARKKAPHEVARLGLMGVVALLVAVGGSVWVMIEGVSGAAAEERKDALEKAFEKSSDELNALRI